MGILALAADERVADVRFTRDTLSVALRDGRTITVPLTWYPRLYNATAAQRKNWHIAGGGYGIHWPDIDEDLSTETTLDRITWFQNRVAQLRRTETNPVNYRAAVSGLLAEIVRMQSSIPVGRFGRLPPCGKSGRGLT